MVLDFLTQRLSTSEEERLSERQKQRRLRDMLDTERQAHKRAINAEVRDHALTVKAFSARNAELDNEKQALALKVKSFSARKAEVRQQLERAEVGKLQLASQNERLLGGNAELREANRRLQAEVARLGETLAATTTLGASAPAQSGLVGTATRTISAARALTATPARGLVGSAVSLFEASSPPPAATPIKGKATPPPPAVTPIKGKATPPPPAATPIKGKATPPPPAVSITMDKATRPPLTATPTKSKATPPPPAATPTKGKATPSPPASTIPRNKTVSSAAAVTPSGARQTPAKTWNTLMVADENQAKVFPPPQAATPNKGKAVNETPRHSTRRPPLGAISLNSGGKQAAGGSTTSLASQLVTKAAGKCTNPIAEGVPPLLAGVVAGTVEKSTSLAARPVVTEPAVKHTASMVEEMPSIDSPIVTGTVVQRTSVEKGPAVKLGRGGTPNTQVVKACESGIGRAKVGAAPSGRVLRSATTSVGKGSDIKVGRGGAPSSRGVAKDRESGKGGGKVRAAPSGRVLRSASRATAAAVVRKKNEAAIPPGVSRAVPVGAAPPAAPARSTRSSTRR